MNNSSIYMGKVLWYNDNILLFVLDGGREP